MRAFFALDQERPKHCTSLLDAVKKAEPSEPLALFLVALALEVDQVDTTLDPRLAPLLEVKDAGPTPGAVSWVGAPVKFKPWKMGARGGAGMVCTRAPPWLVEVEVELGEKTSVVTRQRGFAREYIE
jgi:hypothetical protein